MAIIVLSHSLYPLPSTADSVSRQHSSNISEYRIYTGPKDRNKIQFKMIEVNVSFETACSPCIELMDVQDEAASTQGSKRKSTSLEKLKKYFSTSKDQPTSSSKPIDKDGDTAVASGTVHDGADKGDSTPLPQSSAVPTKMVEYLMHIKGKVPSKELDTDIDKKKVNLIIIVDISGSMGGSPIRQVRTFKVLQNLNYFNSKSLL